MFGELMICPVKSRLNPPVMATSVTSDIEASTDGSKLLPTLGNIQKRFFCGEEELLVWRNALEYCYSAIADNNIDFQLDD